MVRGLRKPGDLLARSDLCHLHDGREEAEACAIEPKLPCQERDVVLRGAVRLEAARMGGPPVAV